ncbi:MAG: imidazole glycerol phosphate synthase subunit HisH [Actinomycetaceae bacterium]|nr:imidazole glycerol phosphate synthase subunit HisH [Actinomycetaceae bacterium]
MTKSVVVLDYGSGNVRSALRACQRVGLDAQLSADPQQVLNADGLVVPGVGAFAAVMSQLEAVGAPQLIDQRLAGGRAVLGICVGMQIMFTDSDEHELTPGLGQWPGHVRRLPAKVVPHIGWSQVHAGENSQLLQGLDGQRFYFVHSYALLEPAEWEAGPLPAPIASWANYQGDFVAAYENGALSATQFHPEKSGDAGMELLSNWKHMLS